MAERPTKSCCAGQLEKFAHGEVEQVQGDFRIDDWLIQPQINSVEKEGKTWHLEPKVMQVLVHLASHPNEVLSKDRLLEAVWHNTFVGDDVLVRCISEIRYVFGDDPKSSRVIQTIPKGGYRLIAAVTTEIQTNIDPAKSLTATPETVFRYNLELDRKKEPQVAVVDEPYKQLTSWSPASEAPASEAEQITAQVVVDPPNRGLVPGVVQNGR